MCKSVEQQYTKSGEWTACLLKESVYPLKMDLWLWLLNLLTDDVVESKHFLIFPK